VYHAKLAILYGATNASDNPWVVIDLVYSPIGVSMWKTQPGFFIGATKGVWETSIFSDYLLLMNMDGDDVAVCWDMDTGWLGYPLEDLAGSEGSFTMQYISKDQKYIGYRSDPTYNPPMRWKLLSV
jgi:hypothetical protein